MRQLQGIAAALDVATGYDHPRNAGVCSALHKLGAIRVEAVVREISANVDEFMGHFVKSLLQPFRFARYLMNNCSGEPTQ